MKKNVSKLSRSNSRTKKNGIFSCTSSSRKRSDYSCSECKNKRSLQKRKRRSRLSLMRRLRWNDIGRWTHKYSTVSKIHSLNLTQNSKTSSLVLILNTIASKTQASFVTI